MRAFAVLASVTGTLLGAELHAQTLSGRVVDEATGHLVQQAQISVLNTADSLVAQGQVQNGRFLIEMYRAGTYSIVVEALGYTPFAGQVSLTDLIVTSIEVRLRIDAIALQPLLVVQERLEPIYMRDLRERRRAGWGKFVTREDLDDRAGARLPDILATVPGLRIVEVQAREGRIPHVETRMANSAFGNCYAALYLNGVRQFPAAAGAGKVKDFMETPIVDIEAIEVYRGPAEVPGIYSGSTAGCGVVAIWLRSGYDGSADETEGGSTGSGTLPAVRISLEAGAQRMIGAGAPDGSRLIRASVVWRVTPSIALGVSHFRSTGTLSPGASEAATRRLDGSAFRIPPGERQLRVSGSGLDAHFNLAELGRVSPFVIARVSRVRRAFSVDWLHLDRLEHFHSPGWGGGFTVGANLTLAANLDLRIATGWDRWELEHYRRLVPESAATWNTRSVGVGLTYVTRR